MARKNRGRLFQRGKKGRFYLQYYVHGKEIVKALTDEDGKPVYKEREAKKARERELAPLRAGTEQQRRRQVYEAMRSAEEVAEKAEEDRNKLPLADVWATYLKSHNRPDSSNATLRQYKFQWNKFTDFLDTNYPDIRHLTDVTPDIANEYVDHLSEKLAPGTVNKHVRLCRLVFKTLAGKHNPFNEIRTKKDVQNSRKEISWDKLCKICDKADGELKTLIFIGLYTGQRLADCCLLTWEQVDLMRNILIITPQKTQRRGGNPLQIPIHSQLRPMFEQIPPEDRQGYVLPELAASYTKSRDRVTDRIQRLFKNCGIQIYKEGTGPGTGNRAVLQYGFHSLRHSTVSLLQEAGTPQAVVQELIGHRSPAMTQRYTHVGNRALEGAVNGLKSISAGTDEENINIRDKAHKLVDQLPEGDLEAFLEQYDR